MKLNSYHYEILNILDARYPKSMRRNNLLALLSDKDPNKFEREISYLWEYGIVEKVEKKLKLGLFGLDMDIPMVVGFKITAKGIDILKEKGKEEYIEKRRKAKQPTAFISASFDDDAESLIRWVRNRAENVGFTTIWLKEIYQARPTPEKIDQAISDSDCIIQILTSHIFEKTGEAGWIGNELGMAFKSRPGKNVAVFVEKGYKASGLAPLLTDIFPLDPENLVGQEKDAEKYLMDLKNKIEGKIDIDINIE